MLEHALAKLFSRGPLSKHQFNMVILGIPEKEAKKLFNGEIQMIVKETSPGSFEWKNVTSIPQYNTSHSMRGKLTFL